MRLIPFALILCTLLVPAAGRAQEHELTLSPFLSYDRYRHSGFDAGLDYGAAAAVHVAEGFSLRAEAAFGTRSIPFDVVGGTQFLSGTITQFSLSAEYRLLGTVRGLALSLSLGAGRIATRVDGTTVSLGALGSLPIPARTGGRGFFEGGATAEAHIAGSVGVFIRPALRTGAAGSAAADVSLEGGLRVGLL